MIRATVQEATDKILDSTDTSIFFTLKQSRISLPSHTGETTFFGSSGYAPESKVIHKIIKLIGYINVKKCSVSESL